MARRFEIDRTKIELHCVVGAHCPDVTYFCHWTKLIPGATSVGMNPRDDHARARPVPAGRHQLTAGTAPFVWISMAAAHLPPGRRCPLSNRE